MQPIQDEIYNAVKEIATQNGYAVVVDRASASSIILPRRVLTSAMRYLQNWDIQINFIHLFQNIDCIQD